MHKNITFLVSLRYPTEKAYGVTIGNTVVALKKKGIKVNILANSINSLDPYGNKVTRLGQTKKVASSNGKRSFYLYKLKYLSYSLNYLRKNPKDVYWTRDLISTFTYLLFFNRKILLEIHHLPKRYKYILLKPLIFFTKLMNRNPLIFTLTERHKLYLSKYFDINQLFILPMAAPQEFFNSNSEFRSFKNLVYIGKGSSSGHDNGLLEFTKKIIPVLEKYIETNCYFVGIEKKYAVMIRNLAIEANLVSRIHLISHMSHEQLPELLFRMDIGFIPYPPTSYNKNRFPIKLVEYGATGCLVIANENETLREIVGEDKVIFYNDTILDFEELFDSIFSNIEKNVEKRKALHNWAKKNTYDLRAEKAINCLKFMNNRSL